MNTLGVATKNSLYKISGGLLTQGFTQDGLKYTITFDADIITSNVITGYVGGTTVTVTYATSNAATLTALNVLIAALTFVKSSTVNTTTRVFTIYPKDQLAGISIVGFAVTAGASQAGVVVAQVDNRVYPGMEVEFLSSGKIAPVTTATADLTGIGTALDKARTTPDNDNAKEPEVVTVGLRGRGIMVTAVASITSLLVGPVAYAGYDVTKQQVKVTSTSVTVTNQIGWAIEAGTNVGDEVRVILK